MGLVFRDDTLGVGKGDLRHREGHPVLFLVLVVLLRIPIEPRLRHHGRLAQVWPLSHIKVWSLCGLVRAL
jgi:hypothetical protein